MSGPRRVTVSSPLVSVFLNGWLVMLALGILHDASPTIPALGYWPCVAMTVLIGMFLAVIRMDNT